MISFAVGGVLFIDEAYALTRNTFGNDYGVETVDTLVKAMPYVRIDADGYGLCTIDCQFSKNDKSTLATLKKDQTITVKGKCEGQSFMSVILNGCTILG